jgi:hypothetical protein
MSYTISGSIITQSGQTSSTRDTPATLSTWAAANGLSANIFLTGRQLTIQGNYRLHINGFYDDTGYINNIASGSRIRFGDGCDWLSGEQVHQSSSNVSDFQGISVKGAKWLCNSWTVDESINLGNGGKLRWYGVDINSDRNIAIGSDTRSDLIFNGTNLDAQFFDCFFVPRGNHRVTGNANVKATGCFFGFGPFYFNGDLQGFTNNTIGSYVTNEVRCNIDNGRTMKGATLKFPLTTTNWVLNLGATTDIRTYQDLGLPSTLNYAGVVGYQGGIVNLTRSFLLPIVKAESPTTAIVSAILYRRELGVLVSYPSASLPTTMLAYTWKWTNADFSFRVAHVTEDRRLCTYFIVDYTRSVVTGQIDVSNSPFTGKAFLPIDSSITQANQTTVAAYTSCDTPQKAYDLSKLWMVNNYTGQTEPSLSRTGNTINTAKNVIIDPTASAAYLENATTITLKASAFAGSISAPSVSLVNGASVADNVVITGNLVYNTNTDIVVTLTNCTISGTVSNASTGNVKLNLVNSSVSTGTRVVAQYPITVTDAGNNLFSTQIWVFNSLGSIVEDTGFQSLIASKTVYMPVGGRLRVYSQAYGYQSKITNTAATNASLVITHIPETLVDTTLDATTRNTIAGHFSSVVESMLLYVEVDMDLVSYTPAQVLNAMHYFIVSNGGNFAALSLLANTVGSVQLIDGGFRVYTAAFKGRAKSTLNSTNTPTLFITLPLYIEDASGVSGNQVMVRNANGIDVHAALWSKATANISQNDMDSIANTTWSHGTRTLNDVYFD